MKWTFNLILMMSIFLEVNTDEELLSFTYKITLGSLFIIMHFGEPRQMMFEEIDQMLPYSWTSELYYHKEASKTYQYITNSTINYLGKDTLAQVVNETIAITKEKIITFLFKLLPFTYLLEQYGGFSFALKYDDEQYSIMHQLRNQNLISNLSYSLVFEGLHKREGKLYLGGIPSHLALNKASGTCKVNSNDYAWGCKLTSIIVENKAYSWNDYAVFQAKEEFIYAPLEFISFLNQTVFKQYYSSDQCSAKGSFGEVIVCHSNILEKLPNITFSFEEFDMTMTLYSLFKVDFTESLFAIRYDDKYKGQWLFGHLFLKEVMALFDYDNKSVTFYKDRGITHHSTTLKQERQMIKAMSIISLIVFVMGIILLLYSKTKIKHSQNLEFPL